MCVPAAGVGLEGHRGRTPDPAEIPEEIEIHALPRVAREEALFAFKNMRGARKTVLSHE